MSHIFISYVRKDIDFAQQIVDALTENDPDTWIDWKRNPYSEDWEDEIYQGIKKQSPFWHKYALMNAELSDHVIGSSRLWKSQI